MINFQNPVINKSCEDQRLFFSLVKNIRYCEGGGEFEIIKCPKPHRLYSIFQVRVYEKLFNSLISMNTGK